MRFQHEEVFEATGRTSGMVGEVVDPKSTHADQRGLLGLNTSVGALRAESLKKSYRRRTVVNDVSIVVHPGEVVGLLGPNGAGKTTTFYMVVGLEEPDQGRVWFGDQDITRLPLYKRSRMGIS